MSNANPGIYRYVSGVLKLIEKIHITLKIYIGTFAWNGIEPAPHA